MVFLKKGKKTRCTFLLELTEVSIMRPESPVWAFYVAVSWLRGFSELEISNRHASNRGTTPRARNPSEGSIA